ncbi:hypothetical protein Tco_0247042 [Tanacetum coccineum]
MESIKKSIEKRAQHKQEYDSRVNERQMQSKEGNVDSSNALDDGLVVTECSGTNSDKQVTSSSSGNYITHAVVADIRPVNDQVPFAEVQLTAQHNVLANEQQNYVQSKPIYDTHLLEKVDRNTTLDSTNMCHRGGEIDQNAKIYQVSCPLLDPSFDNMTTEFSNQSLEISPNKSSAVHEKPNTLSSCLKWKLTGKIFKIVGLRWIPTRKRFTDSTTKVDNEPPNGSNEDITNPYECEQTLNVNLVSQCVSNGHMAFEQFSSGPRLHSLTPGYISSGLMQNPASTTPYVPPSKKDYEILFQPLFDEYFNPPPHAISLDPVAIATPRVVDPTGSPSSTTIDQDVPFASTSPTNQEIQSQVIHQGVEEQILGNQNAQFDNASLLHNLSTYLSSEETTLQGVISLNLHHLNQSFDTLTKLTKNHPLENDIGNHSRPISIRSQLQEHAIWCYFGANDNPIPFGGKRSG